MASEQALREAGIELRDFVRGNEKARERMKAQYSIAGMTSGVVVAPIMQQKPLPDSSLNMVTAVRILIRCIVSTNARSKQLLTALGCGTPL